GRAAARPHLPAPHPGNPSSHPVGARTVRHTVRQTTSRSSALLTRAVDSDAHCHPSLAWWNAPRPGSARCGSRGIGPAARKGWKSLRAGVGGARERDCSCTGPRAAGSAGTDTLGSQSSCFSPDSERAVPANTVDTVVNLCKRRGFVFPCGEIYGGTRSAWDYGPLGVELKDNLKRQWWKSMIQGREDVVGLDSSVILPRQVWEASRSEERCVEQAR